MQNDISKFKKLVLSEAEGQEDEKNFAFYYVILMFAF